MAKDEARRSMPMLSAVGSDGYSAAQVAESVASTLEQMGEKLEPILGAQAVAALYRRCLHLCAATHQPFQSLCAKEEPATSICAIRGMLAQQGSVQARELGDVLIGSFHTLLASLIGEELANQLVGEYTTSSMDRNDQQSNGQ